MKLKQKQEKAKCNLPTYTLFLLSEPKLISCQRLSDILGDLSHDAINRFLIRQQYTPKDLFEAIKTLINLNGGTLSVDDMVIEKEQGFSFALKSNRKVAIEQGKFVQLKDLEIKEEGLIVDLKEVGLVKVFTTRFKNETRYYAIFLPNYHELKKINREKFTIVHDQHWGIEQYHRALKQVCNIERFYVRQTAAISTHIFSSIWAFIQLELFRFNSEIINWYQLKRNMFNEVIRSFILNNLDSKFLNLNYLISDHI